MKHLDRILKHVHHKEKHHEDHHHHHHQKPQSQSKYHPNPSRRDSLLTGFFFRQKGTSPATPPPESHPTGPRHVFAHFIIGNTYSTTPEQWEFDISEAKKAHIDGFALNIAPQDHHTDQSLHAAYDIAERLGGFSLFLSFDYVSGGPWPADRVISTINTYKHRAAQFRWQGRPMVSTFEGPGNAGDWPNIKHATGCMFIPDWSSLSPGGIGSVLDTIDGAFSWDAWPVGAQGKTTASDEAWSKAIAGKPYMMPVSPWFYTNLPQWNKNWLWRGDDLWHDRWKQVIDFQPPLVQILSWNDYGESHYIGPIYEKGLPEGSSRYVSSCPHDAWRVLLPYYIDAYKRQGGAADLNNPRYPVSFTEKIVYWYRRTPGHCGNSDGTTGNNPGFGQPALAPSELSQDRVFVTIAVAKPSELHVQIGYAAPTILKATQPGINHFSVPFHGQMGPVHLVIVRNHREIATATGPAITDVCEDGLANWNAVVGSNE